MERLYEIAGIGFRVEAPDAQFFLEDGLLAPFRQEDARPVHSISLELVPKLREPEGRQIFSGDGMQVYAIPDGQIRYKGVLVNNWQTAYLRNLRRGTESRVQIKKHKNYQRITPVAALESMELEHQLIRHGGFLLHASYIEWNGEAILFTAPSGTGKSTQAELWCRHRGAQLVNGDRAAVMVGQNGVAACGVPYSGLSPVNRNRTLPLKAIVLLSQAKTDSVVRLSGRKAVRSLMEGCCVNTWDREDMHQCMDTVMQVASRVPMYHLACTKDASAVDALEDAMKK